MTGPDGYQSSTPRITIVGRLATYVATTSRWAPGPDCTLEIVALPDGSLLVYGWGISNKAVLITRDDGQRLAEALRAVA